MMASNNLGVTVPRGRAVWPRDPDGAPGATDGCHSSEELPGAPNASDQARREMACQVARLCQAVAKGYREGRKPRSRARTKPLIGWSRRAQPFSRCGKSRPALRLTPERVGALKIKEAPVKALAISLVASAALCFASAPASAMPVANLAPVASDLALHQSVPWVCGPFRCWWRPFYYRPWGYYRPYAYYGYYRPYGSYGYGGYGFGYGGSRDRLCGLLVRQSRRPRTKPPARPFNPPR